MWRRLVASNDPRLAAAESDIAWLLLKSGRAAEGEEMAARAFEVWRANPGDQRLSEIPTALAFIYKHTGRNALATPILREELARLREWHGAEHPTIANALDNFGMHLVALGENEEAEAVLREALAQGRKFHGDRSPHEDHVLARLATLAKRRGDLDAQLDLSRRAMEAGARVYAEGHRYRSESQRQYARTLLEQAELYLDRGLAEGATSVGNESRYLSLASERLATLAASESLMSASRADRPWMQCLLIAIKILKSNELHAPDSENRNRLKESWTASATAVNEKKNATGDQKRRAKKVRTYTERLFESGSRAGKRGEKGD